MRAQQYQRVVTRKVVQSPFTPSSRAEGSTTIVINLNNKKMQSLKIFEDIQFMQEMLNQKQKATKRQQKECLVVLNLSQNQIYTLEGIQKINQIRVDQNIQSLDIKSQFNTLCSKIYELSLHSNSIQSIIPLAKCSQFTSLEKLILQFNKIDTIEGLAKCRMPCLRRITINNNLLTSIKQLQSCRFPELRILGLQSNKLQSLHELSKVDFPCLLYLSFDNNAIRELQFFKSANFSKTLTTIAAAQNKIYRCNFQGTNFQSLIKLNLSSNQIESVEGLGGCNFDNLQNLNLSKNCISCVRFFYRIRAPKLQDLNLQNNKVLQLDSFKYSTFPKIQSIHLSGNKIPYCLWQLMIGLMKNYPSPIMIITFWNCKVVTNKRIVPLKLLKSNFARLNYLQH